METLEARRLLSWTPGDGAGWIMGGTGDFNGDGYADIVWRNQPIAGSPTDGAVRIQYMQGNTVLSVSDVTVNGESFHTFQPNPSVPPTASNPNFIVPAVGEFNLPNSPGPEIVALNGSTKWVYLWGMNGSERTVSKEVGQLNNSQWYIVGTGDFNGDGIDDILWWNSGFLTDGTPVPGGGNLGIWQLNANHVPVWQGLSTPGGPTYTMSPSTWRVAGVADFDGDGTPDVLWQKKAHPTELRVWSTSGSNVFASTTIANTPSTSGLTYQIQGVADMDGNGTLDFLLRQMTGPNNYVWHTSTSNPLQWSHTGTLGLAPSLTPPVLQTPTNVTSNQVTLEWNDVNYETGYEIWMKTGSGSWQLAKAVGQNVSSTTINGLLSETDYAFQVRAKTATNGDQVSNIRSVKTQVGAIHWTGAGGDHLWSNPANWHTNQVPGSTRDVVIDATAADYIIVDGNQEIKSLITSETLRITGSLKVQSTAQVNASASIELAGGTITGGEWTGAGQIVVTGSGTASGASLEVNVHIPASAHLTIVNGLGIAANIAITGSGDLRFVGTQTLTGTGVTITSANRVIDIADGTLTIGNGVVLIASGTIESQTEDGLLYNAGTITSATPGTLEISVPSFENSGLIEATAGEILLSTAWFENASSGNVSAAGGFIHLTNSWRNLGTLSTSAGQLKLDGTYSTDDIGTVQNLGGTLIYSGTINNEDRVLSVLDAINVEDATILGGTVVGAINGEPAIDFSGVLIGSMLEGKVIVPAGKTLEIYNSFQLGREDEAGIILISEEATLSLKNVSVITGVGMIAGQSADATIKIDGPVHTTQHISIQGAGVIEGTSPTASLKVDWTIASDKGVLTVNVPVVAYSVSSVLGGLILPNAVVTDYISVRSGSVTLNGGDPIYVNMSRVSPTAGKLEWNFPLSAEDTITVYVYGPDDIFTPILEETLTGSTTEYIMEGLDLDRLYWVEIYGQSSSGITYMFTANTIPLWL